MTTIPLFYSLVNSPSRRVDKETAFFEDKSRIFDGLKDCFNDTPCAAPSSIFRCLALRKQEEVKNPSPAKSVATGKNSSFFATCHSGTPLELNCAFDSTSTSNGIILKEKDDDELRKSSASSSIIISQRAQRGLQPRDELLQRLFKRKQKSLAGKVQGGCEVKSGPCSSTDSSDFSGLVSNTGAAITEVVPVHWSKRMFSAMTCTSWQVFREEVGISVEIVRSRALLPTPSLPLPPSMIDIRTEFTVPPPIRCWGEAGLPYILGMIVAKMFAFPTAIQSQCVPILLQATPSPNSSLSERKIVEKVDLLAVSETGGGKTVSYLVPAITDILLYRPKLLGNHNLMSLGPFVLIAVPTRELAEQVFGEAQKIIKGNILSTENGISVRDLEEEQQKLICASSSGGNEKTVEEYKKQHNLLEEIRIVKVVGGERVDEQHEQLSYGAHIVVGTIGQLYALLEARLLSLGNTQMIIVDEADRMMEENSKGYLDAVLQQAPPRELRQTALFTATLTTKCEKMAREYFLPQRGHVVVRTPYRCPTVRQEFEVFPSTIATAIPPTSSGEMTGNLRMTNTTDKKNKGKREEGLVTHDRDLELIDIDKGRTHGASSGITGATLAYRGVHPMKFTRLVKWLLYAPPPIIIFANEKKTCDALQDALLDEETRFRRDYPDISSIQAVIGECPESLAFLQSFNHQRSTGEGDTSRCSISSSSSHPTISLANLSSVAVVHSENSQEERKRLVQYFQRGERRVLITTDLLARGLDVPGVSIVVNYDVPWPRVLRAGKGKSAMRREVKRVKHDENEDIPAQENTNGCGADEDEEAISLYIHRIGRTGRAGVFGLAVSFLCLPEKVLEEMQRGEKRQFDGGGVGRSVLWNMSLHSLRNETESGREWSNIQEEENLDSSSSSSAEEEEEEEEEGDSMQEVLQRWRKRGKGKKSTSSALVPFSNFFFSDDVSFLPLLWKFLLNVAVSNQHEVSIKMDPSRLLLENRFNRIFLPPALSSLMYREAEGQHMDALVL